MAADDASIIDKLKNYENFEIWKFQINIIFKANNLIDIINGKSLLRDIKEEDDKSKWYIKDAKAQKFIISSIEKTVLVHILNCTNAKEMYDKLSAIFEKDDEQMKCKTLQDFYSYKYDKNSDMTTNLSKIQNLAYKLNNLKQKIDEDMVIIKIMTILPDEYKYFNTAWDSTSKEEKTLTNLISRLTQEESKLINTKHEERVAMSATKQKQIRCFSCDKVGHLSKNCKQKHKCSICKKTNHSENNCLFRKDKTNNPKNNQMYCKICKKTNHHQNECYFRPKETNSKFSFLVEQSAESDENISLEFIIDSGSSSHMVNNLEMLRELKPVDMKITVAKKNKML